MTNRLEISLLGRIDIKLAGQPLPGLVTRKAEALLIYLVCTGRPQAREVLAELLWPERPLAQARRNLRTDLSRLRQRLESFLISSPQQLAFNRDEPYARQSRRLIHLQAGLQISRLQK